MLRISQLRFLPSICVLLTGFSLAGLVYLWGERSNDPRPPQTTRIIAGVTRIPLPTATPGPTPTREIVTPTSPRRNSSLASLVELWEAGDKEGIRKEVYQDCNVYCDGVTVLVEHDNTEEGLAEIRAWQEANGRIPLVDAYLQPPGPGVGEHFYLYRLPVGLIRSLGELEAVEDLQLHSLGCPSIRIYPLDSKPWQRECPMLERHLPGNSTP